jgi:glycogen debranching enzyme
MTSTDYIGVYRGDVYQRDAAYHQGTVWSWLIGPLVKAWCRAHPNQRDVAAGWLTGLEVHLGEACIGQVSEIFEGDTPHAPKGCFAQAWSVAELLSAKHSVEMC